MPSGVPLLKCAILHWLDVDRMQYTTIFDFAQQPYPWRDVLPVGCFVLLGMLLTIFAAPVARFQTRRTFKSPAAVRAFGILLTIFALLLTVLIYQSVNTQYVTYHHLLETGDAATVEGTVRLFSPLPADGHGYESFYVADLFFAYAPNESELAYHEASAKQGWLANGVRVRITYVTIARSTALTARKILRLELQPDSADNPSFSAQRPNTALQPTAYGAQDRGDFSNRVRRLGGG